MSSIRKLAIKGIRNFDDGADSPTIKFSRPLTLILGPNGTGKTTIIECLRYILSGEFPPDSDRGKAFIHNPMLGERDTGHIRGNVKLEIIDALGNPQIISRTIEASRLRDNRLTFKTLDSCISRYDETKGEIVSLTTKCADIDTEVLSVVGVSKAIINYVLFCHQDDANWPFESGKKLKERFDEIFDTTRYNKALETVRKLVKDKQTEMKILSGEKRALDIIVAEVKSKKKNLKRSEDRRDETQKKMTECMDALKPINDRLAEIKEIEAEYCKWQIEDEKKKFEYRHAKEQIMLLKENIKEVFSGSTAELKHEIESYEEILSGKNNEIAAVEDELQQGTAKETRIASLMAEKRVTVGTLKQQMRDQMARIAKRNTSLREMLAAWKMNENVDSNVSEEDAVKIVKKLEKKLRQMESETEAERVEQERENEQLQRKVNVLRAERTTIESQLAHNESELVKIKGEIRVNRSLLRQSGTMEEKLNEVDANLDRANKKVEDLTKSFEIESLKRQIQAATESEEETEREFNNADKEINLLREQGALRMKLESSQIELIEKEHEVLILKEKHEDTLMALLGKNVLPDGNMMETVNGAQTILVKRVQNLRTEIEKVQYEEMKVKTALEHKKLELDKKVKEIGSDKEKLSSHCKDYTNYREFLLLQSKKLKDLEDQRGMYAYQGVAYKGYVQQLNRPESCCPLCSRGFSNTREAKTLAEKLQNDMSEHPNRLRNSERELTNQRNKYDALLQLQPLVEKIENFERVENAKLRQEIDVNMKNLTALGLKAKRLQESMAEPERKLSEIKNMVGDMALWDRYADEIKCLTAFVAEIHEELRSAGLKGDKTLQEAQTEYNNLQQRLKDTRREIKTLQATLDSRNEELRRATENRTKILELQLRIHKEMQEVKQAKEVLDSLLVKEKTIADDVRNFEERIAEIDDKLQTAIANLETVKKDHRTKQESSRLNLRERSKDFDQLNSIHAEVSEFFARKIDEQLESTESQLKFAEEKVEKLKAERTIRETKIAKMKQDIHSHDTRKRDLVDNLTLRQKEVEVVSLRCARQEIRDKLGGANVGAISIERKELCATRDTAECERNVARGNLEELERNVEQLKRELEKTEYAKAESNYQDKCVELTTARSCVDDLTLYSQVLDIAMIQYHEERMSTVNQFMGRLWRLIYTGTDTTSIEIHTEATATTGGKRQFNYKLVQVKHGVEMDMRGRCSAGQRVLASIILRLALAETFCEKCGVLALDEPTTNLDEQNAQSLASALCKYVKHRQHESNFQLIVITHDDCFIPKLGQLSSRNAYWELYRHKTGLSGIRSVSLDTLTAEIVKREKPDGEAAENPAEGTAETEKPVEKTKKTKRPMEKTRSTERPMEKTRSTERPMEKTRYTERPIEKTRTTERPMEKTRSTERPMEKTKNIERPVAQKKYAGKPVQKKKDTEKAGSSEDQGGAGSDDSCDSNREFALG